ncbi:hypothetical protein FA048_15295 [Pedobacter polaris]|uniref:Uncharacterized protein n=1 Tax=Pedobacter polaris TaxID=2571273 RepID=A0A4U1CMN1_9SPHI|nr:hypothetical protein [Pedobacter polaris]TKC06573.1 hypothetical protein FA048_15295 [Pedobacter polaris]
MDHVAHSKLTDTWDRYNQVRIAGDKRTANKILVDYIALLKQQDEQEIKIFVDHICSLTLEIDDKIIANNGTEVSDRDTRIQHPLFKEIILPVLKKQYQKGSPKHIKWIGQLEQFFYSDNTTTNTFLKELNISEYFEARYFFEKSFALDNSQKTLSLLLNRIAKDINYYVHELPTVVLAEPEFLEKELEIFRLYLQQFDNKNIWEVSLSEWELIAKHWKLHVAAKDEYGDFEDYLKANGIKFF